MHSHQHESRSPIYALVVSQAVRFVAAIALSFAAIPARGQQTGVQTNISGESNVNEFRLEESIDLEPALLIDSGGTLSLERLTAEVLRRNPSVALATHSLDAARERTQQVSALDDPVFSYMLGPGTVGSSEFNFAQKFEASQSFSWPGKRRLRGEVTEQDAESLRGELEAVREQLAYAVRSTYLELWLTDRAHDINQTNQNLLQEFEEIAQQKYAAGIVPKQDALQARVEREMLVHDGAVLSRMRNRAVARINALLNQPTASTLPNPPVSLSPVIPPSPLAGLQTMAEQNRPELVSVNWRIRARMTQTELARKEYYPDFSLMAGYDSFWNEEELRPSVGFSITVPIQVGRRRAAVREADAELARAESEARAIHREILLEVHQAFEEVRESIDGIALYESHLLPVAEENLEAARSGYASGEVDFLALIGAQKLVADTTLRSQEFYAAYYLGMAKLGRATGLASDDPMLTLE